MSFTQLQSLSSLMKTQVDEAKKKSDEAQVMKLPTLKQLHATMDFMNDSTSDLRDALGTISEYVPASKVAALKAALDVFVKKMEDAVTDVEVEVMAQEVPMKESVSECKLTEAKDYGDSAEFTEELGKLGSLIHDVKQIVVQPRWKNWMKVTDHNFSTSAVALNKDLTDQAMSLDKSFNALEDELHSAE